MQGLFESKKKHPETDSSPPLGPISLHSEELQAEKSRGFHSKLFQLSALMSK